MSLMAMLALWAAGAPVAVEHVRLAVGDGTVLENATVVWDNGRITAVGPPGPLPADVQRYDGSHRVLTPGLIAVRSRLGISEVDEEASTTDTEVDKGLATPALRVADGYNPASLRIAVAREAGITAAVVAPQGRILHGTGAWVLLHGASLERPEPVAMFGSISRLTPGTLAARSGIWLTLREIWEDTRFYMQNRAAVERGEARRRMLSPAHLAALVPVVEGKLPLVLEANRASDIAAAVHWCRQERIRLVVAGGAEAWKVAPLLAEARVPVILNPSHAEPSSFEALGSRVDAAQLLHAAHVPLILATGDSNTEAPRLRQEAGLAVAYGLPYAAALPAITATPAQVFGRDKQEGSVAVGKRANLVLWSGDPFETSTVAEAVWIEGVLQAAPTRQRLLVERYLRGGF